MITVSQMRKLRLSEIVYHVPTIVTDHMSKCHIDRSVYPKAYIYCIRKRAGRGKRRGRIKERKIRNGEQERNKEVTSFLPQQALLCTRASLRTNCHHVVFQFITPWHQQVLICEKKTMTLKGS